MRRIGFETMTRACEFGSLAIFCIMVGLLFNPLVAFQSGGALTMFMVVKAFEGSPTGGSGAEADNYAHAGDLPDVRPVDVGD